MHLDHLVELNCLVLFVLELLNQLYKYHTVTIHFVRVAEYSCLVLFVLTFERAVHTLHGDHASWSSCRVELFSVICSRTFEPAVQIPHCDHSFCSCCRVELFDVICSNFWTSCTNTTLWPFILIVLQSRSVKCSWYLKTQKSKIFRIFLLVYILDVWKHIL